MSEQADGFMTSDRQVEEEGSGMHQAHEKIHNSVFISNSNINPYADDELLTWLQYLLDDACPDVFQPFPSPAATGGSSSSSFAVKYLPHQEDEAWMVARDFDKRAAEGWISKDLDRKTDAHLKQFFQEEESWAVKDASEQRAGGGQEENPLMKHRKETAPAAAAGGGPLHLDQEEGAEEERNEGGGGKGRDGSWVGKQLGDRQGFAKDGRNLAQLKLLAQQKGERKAAKEAQVAASAAHFKRSPQEEAVWMNKDPDSNRIHTALFRHLPQDEEGPGLQKKATSQFRNMAHFAEESWLSHELHREAAAHLPQTKEGSWMKKELGRNLTAMDGTQSTSSALANPAADAALALGAGRAAGAIRPSGVEAFNKVRTALQPRQPPKLGSPPSCNFASPRNLAEKNSSSLASFILPPRIKTFGSYASMFASQPAQQKGEVKLLNLAQRHLTKPFVGFPNIGSQENKLRLNPTGGGSNVNSSSKDIHLESSTTALSVSQGMEKLSARVQQQSSAGQAMGGGGGGSAAVASGIDTIDMAKLSCFSFPSQEKKAECAFSGGSQTSGSFKETVSGSKRKLVEDSECQSEDAEGESAVNSQAGNSSSKRTRANEVHNLSERRRRNRINDKMNALRELIPNASKSNKAALLDEAIDYLKNLQLQLQVMSLRSGVSMLPMVLPPDLLHRGPVQPVGMGMSGGSSGTMAGVAMCDMTYSVPTTRPLSSLASVSAPISSELRPLQSSTENDSISQFQASTTPESVPLHFCHSHVQAPSQSISSVNMNMYLQQQQQIQEQQLQMLQQFHRQQQQGLHLSQAPLPLPLPQQWPHQ